MRPWLGRLISAGIACAVATRIPATRTSAAQERPDRGGVSSCGRSGRLSGRSSSGRHLPSEASAFMRARWAKAACAAATFSRLAVPGAAAPRSAAPGHRRRSAPRAGGRAGSWPRDGRSPASSVWPPERKAMPGHGAGTCARSTSTVRARDVLDAGALARADAGQHHVGLEQHAGEIDAGEPQFA